jgi:hypothetical protein
MFLWAFSHFCTEKEEPLSQQWYNTSSIPTRVILVVDAEEGTLQGYIVDGFHRPL